MGSAAHHFLAGGGEMGDRIRAMDWAATPLGPIERWPQSLRSAVSILLPSKAQIALFWGEELITLYNDAYRPVFGAKHPHALGQPIREAWDELWRAGLKELFDGVLATGEAFWARDRPFFMERHRYLEETYFDVSYDPVRDESGRVGGVFCIVSETTGRVVGERRLRALRDLGRIAPQARQAAQVYEAAAQVLRDSALDLPFALLYGAEQAGGPAQLFGQAGLPPASAAAPARLPASEGPSWPAVDGLVVLEGEALAAFGPLQAGPWPEPIGQVAVLPFAQAGEPAQGWLVAGISPRRRIDDDYRDFLRLVASAIAAAVASARRSEDERRRAEMLAELDRAKTTFFSNVSHEFRTPLTLMLGPLDDALADGASPLPPAQRERLELAHRSALRLQKLVNTLLDFSRIEAGRLEARYRQTDLAHLTAELASAFRSAIEKAGLRLVVDCPPHEAQAWVDHDLWEKIVFNLLSNAFKFTFDGEIAVRLRQADGHFELAVSDTGTGIPAAELPRLFERFHRVEGARSRTHEGTGIGLALVQELARLHGGTVSVQSEAGRGSTFTVRIPCGREHLPPQHVGTAPAQASTALGVQPYLQEALRWLPDPPQPGTPQAEPGCAPAPRQRVLLADDNADMRHYVQRLLAPSYEVQAVADGAAALAAARARPPDLLLADVMMPGLDGLALVRALRAEPATRSLPVILLSARAGESPRIEGLDAGADDYLEKPFGARELLARVAARLEVTGLRRRAEADARAQATALERLNADNARLLAQRAQLIDELRDADRRKDEFIATLSHELRNPLAPLRNGLHVLRNGGAHDGSAQRIHEMMERQLEHLVRLVDDLLEVSRISRGVLELRTERVAVATIVRHAVETSEPLIREAGHELSTSLPAQPLWVEGDPVRLAQVLSNLLNNAARYTPRGGRIRLAVQQRDGQVVLSVRDNGMGIAPEAIPRLFRIFERGKHSSGLGVGLALAHHLVQLHQGRIEATSEGPGRGAEFRVTLPLAEVQQPPEESARAAPAAASRHRILVVDDNRDAAESLQMLLEQLGAQVQVAHDGHDALQAFGWFNPSLVLLDIGMPGMDGYQLAHALQQRHPGHGAVLVALSGWGQAQDRERGRAAGLHHHLVKPAELATLQALVAGLDRPCPDGTAARPL